MKIITETKLNEFKAWSGAVNTLNTIIENNKIDELEELLEEFYPDGVDETKLNDLLWFDAEWLFESLGIENEDYTVY